MQVNLVNNEEEALYLWLWLFRVVLGLALCCVLALHWVSASCSILGVVI